MNDKVVSINKGVSIEAINGTGPDPYLVAKVEKLLENVKAGVAVSVYAVGFEENGDAYSLTWFGSDNLYEAIGIISALKARYEAELNRHVTGFLNEQDPT